MDKLWDLDVEIQLAASYIDHGLEIFIIPEPSGATLDVLYDAVHPFQNGVRIGVLEVVQDLVPMIADRAAELLHGFQPCVHHLAAELTMKTYPPQLKKAQKSPIYVCGIKFMWLHPRVWLLPVSSPVFQFSQIALDFSIPIELVAIFGS